MNNLDGLPHEFTHFLGEVFASRIFTYYRHDFLKLLLLMQDAQKDSLLELMTRPRLVNLTMHCDYILIKMKTDSRRHVKENIPRWLKALAGHYDDLNIGKRYQMLTYFKLCHLSGSLLSTYDKKSN